MRALLVASATPVTARRRSRVIDRRDVAERLRETLSGTGVPLLGVIANGFKTGRRGSYGAYAYDYSYVSEQQPVAAPAAGASPNAAGSHRDPSSVNPPAGHL